MKKLVSVFAHDLASNPIGRLSPILEALQATGYQTEVLGFLIAGTGVYLPYKDKYNYITMRSNGSLADVIRKAPALARKASGSIIYAGKPLFTSFWPALLASGFGRKHPLLLDVEDNDVWGAPTSETLRGFTSCYIRGFKSATACKWGILLHPLTKFAAHVTVSSQQLKKIYGGTILRHGPDPQSFDPALPCNSPLVWKRHYGLDPSRLCIGFAGTPHSHKGFDRVLNAVVASSYPYQLLLCGPKEHPHFRDAKERLGSRCILTGFLPNAEMPSFLAASDIVPVFQQPTPYTQAQLPSKLMEAMAMGKLVICSRVGDLPYIVSQADCDTRGWVVEPHSDNVLVSLLNLIPSISAEQRIKIQDSARAWFLNNASVVANVRVLKPVLEAL